MFFLSSILNTLFWFAIPLVGFFVLGEKSFFLIKTKIGSGNTLFVLFISGIAFLSLPMMVLAILGIYKAEYISMLSFIIIGICFYRNSLSLKDLKNILAKNITELRLLNIWSYIFIVGLIFAAFLYFAFPTESILGGRDQGVYANHAIHISHHGRLDIPYPSISINSSQEEILKKISFPGFYNTQPTMTVQFGHLFPIWLSQAFSSFGHHGLFRFNGFLTVISVGIFYTLCKLFVSQPYAVLASLFLAFNPSEIYLSRITLTEILAQLLVLSGLLFFILSLQNRNKTLARWAGFLFGLSAFARIDMLLIPSFIFISHLLTRLFIKDENNHNQIWSNVYLTSIPTFLGSVIYYRFFSFLYFTALFKHIGMMLGLAIFAAFCLLFSCKINDNNRLFLYSFIQKYKIIETISLFIFTLAIYGYFLRPHIEPYALYDWPSNALDGTRNYQEDSLVRLAKYLSPLVVWLGTVGFISSILEFRKVKQSKNRNKIYYSVIPLLTFFGASSFIYLWNPSISPDHFWAVRRFVPAVIPGFIFFSNIYIFKLIKLVKKKHQSISSAISLLILTFLALFTIKVGSFMWFFSEQKMVFEQIKLIVHKLPEKSIVMMDDSTFSTPLAISFDKKIIPINENTKNRYMLPKDNSKNINNPSLILSPNLYFLSSYRHPNGIFVDSFNVSWKAVQSTTSPLPRNIIEKNINFNFYQLTDAIDSKDYLNKNFGVYNYWGVSNEDLYSVEKDELKDEFWRWTKGNASWTVPINADSPPQFLQGFIEGSNPTPIHFSILVNGQKIFEDTISEEDWHENISLANVQQKLIKNKQALIEIKSDTWKPIELIPNSIDGRTLGLQIKSLKLIR